MNTTHSAHRVGSVGSDQPAQMINSGYAHYTRVGRQEVGIMVEAEAETEVDPEVELPVRPALWKRMGNRWPTTILI